MNELVQAVAEEVCKAIHDLTPKARAESGGSCKRCRKIGLVALQAAFAKLGECFMAEVTGNDDDRQRAEGWNECLAALAREFGGRE